MLKKQRSSLSHMSKLEIILFSSDLKELVVGSILFYRENQFGTDPKTLKVNTAIVIYLLEYESLQKEKLLQLLIFAKN